MASVNETTHLHSADRELLLRRGENNDVKALLNLGDFHNTGSYGFEKDLSAAKHFYERAAELGDVRAMCNLGDLLLIGGDGVEKDASAAKTVFERAVELGDVRAMFSLGKLLRSGDEGVDKDAAAAKAVYERAAELGDVYAMFNLGNLLLFGDDGVEKDASAAKKVFRRAVELGDVHSMNALGVLLCHGDDGVEKDAVAAKAVLEQAVEHGHVVAMCNLGKLLFIGGDGVEKDAVAAKTVYERAVEHGNVVAMYNLGILLLEGDDGVPRDEENSSALFAQAAKNGHENASTKIADNLISGRGGFRRNLVDARQLLEEVIATSSHPWTKMRLAQLLLSEEDSDANWPRAVELFQSAVDEANFDIAHHELAVFYERSVSEGHSGPSAHPNVAELAQYHFEAATTGSAAGVSRSAFLDSVLAAGANYDRVVTEILRSTTAGPKTCLLLTLGGPSRGKTSTLSSLRGMPFCSEHIPTVMADICKFIIDPGTREFDYVLMDELDFKENSFLANATRRFYNQVDDKGEREEQGKQTVKLQAQEYWMDVELIAGKQLPLSCMQMS